MCCRRAQRCGVALVPDSADQALLLAGCPVALLLASFSLARPCSTASAGCGSGPKRPGPHVGLALALGRPTRAQVSSGRPPVADATGAGIRRCGRGPGRARRRGSAHGTHMWSGLTWTPAPAQTARACERGAQLQQQAACTRMEGARQLLAAGATEAAAAAAVANAAAAAAANSTTGSGLQLDMRVGGLLDDSLTEMWGERSGRVGGRAAPRTRRQLPHPPACRSPRFPARHPPQCSSARTWSSSSR